MSKPFPLAFDMDRVKQSILASFFLIVAIYIFVTAFEFAREAALLPQLSAAVVIIGCLLILLEKHLPEKLQAVVSEDVQLVQEPDEIDISQDDTDDNSSNEDTSSKKAKTTDNLLGFHNSLVTGLIIVVYAVISYLVGFLLATPIMAVMYGIIFKLSVRNLLIVSAMSIIVPIGFIELMNAPLDEGQYSLIEYETILRLLP